MAALSSASTLRSPRAKELAVPCLNDPRSRRFDFWIGDWQLTGTNGGQPAGENLITRQDEGCVIHERYTTSYGYSGQSLNFYDPVVDKWRQVWVDTSGNVIDYVGDLVDGEMRMEGTAHQRDGSTQLSRVTFTPNPDGTVRQFMERSTDDGETWTVAFDAVYSKKKP